MKRIMTMAMAVVAAMVGQTALAVDAKSYVQDGLIAQWDGIDNVGTGMHDASAKTWKDLKGTYDLELMSGGTWGEKWLNAIGPSAKGSVAAPTYKTIEIVFRQTKAIYEMIVFYSANKTGGVNGRSPRWVCVDDYGKKCYFDGCRNTSYIPLAYDATADHAVAGVYDDNSIVTTVYSNGVAVVNPGSITDNWGMGANYMMVGSRKDAGDAYNFAGRIYTIRLYDRVLSAEEIAANRRVDGARFLGEVTDDQVEVTMNPVYSGITLDPSGTVGGLAKGDTKTFKAPAEPVEVSSDTRATCTGWKLYDKAGTLLTSGKGATYEHTHPGTYCRLEWQFKTEYKLAVTTAGSGSGTVSSYDVWHASGSSCTVTATPATGSQLFGWQGDTAGAKFEGNAITLTFDGPKSIVACFGKPLYVSPTGSDDSANPYDEATPYKTIAKGVSSAADYDIVQIAAGTYKESFTLTRPISVAGAGMDQTIISGCYVKLDHADAIVRDLRVTGYTSGGALYIAKGTAMRCDISRNSRTSTAGTGVKLFSGALVDCVVTNNWNGSGGVGIGVYVEATGDCRVSGCFVADNTTGYNSGVGGIYVTRGVSGANVTIDHTTSVGNSGGDSSGLYVTSGDINVTVTDSLIARNIKLKAEATDASEDITIGGNTKYARILKNCVIGRCPTLASSVTTQNCLVNIGAGLWDPPAKDFRIGANSPARGAATDGSDIGCEQTEHGSALAVGCYAVVDRGLDSLETDLVGTALNASGSVTYAWDLDGDGTYEEEGATVHATFTQCGWQSVRVKATDGVTSKEATVEHVACVCPPTTYIWTKSPNPTFPYATWDTAAHDPQLALSGVFDGGRLQFTNETISVASALISHRPIEIAGAGQDAGGTILKEGGWNTVLRLYNAGAVVHSLALGPAYPNVLSLAGDSIVSNCVVRNGHYTSGNGVGISASAGLITHCVITNNTNSGANGNYGTKGTQVYLTGSAKLRNSLVAYGVARSTSDTGVCGAVYAGDGTEVANCTIVNNVAGSGAGLFTDGKARIFNNIINGNTSVAKHPEEWYDKSGTSIASNNCANAAVASAVNTITLNPGFTTDDAGFPWAIKAASPCADAGVAQAWVGEGTTDLCGNARVQGTAIDIGCYDADMSQATCGIQAAPAEAFGEADVTFKAVVTGKTLPDTTQYLWDLDGDGTYERSGICVTTRCGEGYHSARLKVVDGEETLFDVEGEADMVKVYPRVLYFDGANEEGAAFPYNTKATAAAKMSDVMSAAKEGVDIRVLPGRHPCDAQIMLNMACTFEADDPSVGRPTLLRKFGGGAFVALGNAQAVVKDIVFDDDKYYTGVVSMNDGVVQNCVISNAYYTSGAGIGAWLAGGLVDRCEFVDVTGTDCGTAFAGAGLVVALTGGTMRNSLIRRCKCVAKSGRAGGLVAVHAGATLENCTIAQCTNLTRSVLSTIGAATVRNTVIYDNNGGDTNVDQSPWWPSYSPMKNLNYGSITLDTTVNTEFYYNAYAIAEGEKYGATDLLLSASPFVTRATPHQPLYSPAADAPIFDAGTNTDWTVEALDLYGFPRVRGKGVDMGCSERSFIYGLMLIVK